MTPYYGWITVPYIADKIFKSLLDLQWLQVRDARLEYFMGDSGVEYTYGKPPNDKTYVAKPWTQEVSYIKELLEKEFPQSYNVCFLNRYNHQKHQLGWHSDDSPHPIAVVSFGAEREIWWKKPEEKGVVPLEQRKLLGHGSIFIMPEGFQQIYVHRIPKADREVGVRISLTFRRFK